MHPLILTTLFFTTLTHAFRPGHWDSQLTPNSQLLCARMRDRSSSLLVASAQPGAPTINDIIGPCKNAQGQAVAAPDCQYAVLINGASMALAVLSYRTDSYWAGAFGPNGVNKRDEVVAASDDFFSRLPDHLSISNIKLHNSPLSPNTSSPSLHRRKDTLHDYNVFYNGSLPLTFMLHHEIETETTTHVVPLFAATDGTTMVLSHVEAIPETKLEGWLERRSGYLPYNHVGAGGLKLLANSDPVATWGDTQGWLNWMWDSPGVKPYDLLYAMADRGIWVGHSLVNYVHDKQSGYGYNGQWGMEGYYHGFSPDWEGDFNWCFGAYPNNC